MLAIFTRYDTTKLKVKNAVTAVQNICAHLQASLDKEKSSELTKTLNGLDHQRDVLISAFINYLEAMTSFPVKTTAAAAAEMLHYAEGFGKHIDRQSDLSETTILTNITDGFTTNPARKTALAAMGGTEWITALAAINTEYATLYGTRVSKDSTNNKTESFSTVRKKANTLYTALLNLLANRYGSDKDDQLDVTIYEACIAEINELANKVNALVAASKTKTAVAATVTPVVE